MAKRIALFIGQIIQDYQREMTQAVAETAEDMGYRLDAFSDFGSYGENYLHADGEKAIINLPYLEDYQGIIIASDTFDVKGMYEELTDKIKGSANCPVVTLRSEDERFYNVLIDDYAAMKDVVEHFIITHQYKKICFMTGKLDMLDAQRRLQAYRDTMEKYNLPVTEHMIFEGDYWRYKDEEAVEWFLTGEEMPEAIVCSNDYMAISICEALRKRGCRVPEDIGVSGFDNIDEAYYSEPPIASVDLPIKSMAQIAVQTIDKIVKGYAAEKYMYVGVSGCYQGTCGCSMKMQGNRITELYSRGLYLQNAIKRLSYMNVDFENCNNMQELLHTAFVYSYYFAYDTMYLCLCDAFNKPEEELIASEQYTDKIYLRAIMSRDLGLTDEVEIFDRREILPEKYRKEGAVLYIFPLHYKNHCLGYLAMQSERIDGLKEIFPSWVLWLGSFIDKVKTYSQNKELMCFREQSLRDELTGLHNRRMMEKALRTRTQRAYSKKVSFCVVNVDMDGLKMINDTYGHREGDCALKAIADAMKSVESETVICARVGGDEFSICVDTSEERVVEELIEKIQQWMAEYNRKQGKPYQLSASFGYAFYQRGKELADCLERADQNMYRNKAQKKKDGNYPKGGTL